MSNLVDVIIPSIGESITVAYIAEIFAQPGEAVAQGDPVFSVDSDKATLEVPAPCSGVIENLSIAEGDEVPIGAVVGQIKEGAAPAAAQSSLAARRNLILAPVGPPSTRRTIAARLATRATW